MGKIQFQWKIKFIIKFLDQNSHNLWSIKYGYFGPLCFSENLFSIYKKHFPKF